jgi:hypothetical protein
MKVLAILAFLVIFHSVSAANYTQLSGYPEPLFSSSSIQAQQNLTTYEFRIYNPENIPTTAFRLWLNSSFDWFNPADLTYMLAPDGVVGNSPYWDLPPLLPNESTEVSFSVRGAVGMPQSISVTAVPIDNWSGNCQLQQFNVSGTDLSLVADFLNETNRSQNLTGYYESGALLLAYLQDYGTFAVFSINGTAAVPVDDQAAVTALVSSYASEAAQPSAANLSLPYYALLQTQSLKYGPEHACYVLTGMDTDPCVNRSTCLYACFSVPVCSDLGSNGWSFIDTIQAYNASVYNVNQLLDTALASSYALSTAPSYATAQTTLDEMTALNRAETSVIFQPLIASYGFCAPPEYGMPLQTGATRELLDYLDANCAQGQAGRITNESLHAAVLLAPPPGNMAGNVSAAVQPANASNPTVTAQSPANATTTQDLANATSAQPNATGTPAPNDVVLIIAAIVLLVCGFLLGRIAARHMR